ncbi:hypothetical protein [Paraburkholderia sp. BR14320]|uniref:hypothetical protein n=1 Tax=unclassified Paraburkholderia TaxID=2615204 RepID=UPI0034CF1D54
MNKLIEDELGAPEKTVKIHWARVTEKTNLESLAELVCRQRKARSLPLLHARLSRRWEPATRTPRFSGALQIVRRALRAMLGISQVQIARRDVRAGETVAARLSVPRKRLSASAAPLTMQRESGLSQIPSSCTPRTLSHSA